MPRIVKAVTSVYTAMDEDSSEEEERDSSSGEEEGQVLPLGEEEEWEEVFDHPVWRQEEQ
jgi:hypothetical protein